MRYSHSILDYVGAILGLVRDGSDWRLDPLMVSFPFHVFLSVSSLTASQTIRNKNHDLEPVGEGNVVSVEFNLLYRWHSTFSEQDAEWTTNMFNRLFEGKDPKDVSRGPQNTELTSNSSDRHRSLSTTSR